MNKKKKLAIAITSASLVLVVAIGASLAYFTDSQKKENVVTMGKIDVTLSETMEDKDGIEVPYVDPVNVQPNQVVSKIPNIKNESTENECYVRAVIEIQNPGKASPKLDIKGINIASGWSVVPFANQTSRWYCYYNTKLTPGQTVKPFTEVTIPEQWNNDVAGDKLKIIVTAEAIQADNFTPVKDAQGNITAWTLKDGTPVSPEAYQGK